MLALVSHHGIDVIWSSRGRSRSESPTSEYSGEVVDCSLSVGRNILAHRIQLWSAILIQFNSANGVELQNLARIILVRIGLGVVGHVQMIAHGRIERDFQEQLAVIA